MLPFCNIVRQSSGSVFFARIPGTNPQRLCYDRYNQTKQNRYTSPFGNIQPHRTYLELLDEQCW